MAFLVFVASLMTISLAALIPYILRSVFRIEETRFDSWLLFFPLVWSLFFSGISAAFIRDYFLYPEFTTDVEIVWVLVAFVIAPFYGGYRQRAGIRSRSRRQRR